MADRGRHRATMLAASRLMDDVAELLRLSHEEGPAAVRLPLGKRDIGFYSRRLEWYARWLVEHGLHPPTKKRKGEANAKRGAARNQRS